MCLPPVWKRIIEEDICFNRPEEFGYRWDIAAVRFGCRGRRRRQSDRGIEAAAWSAAAYMDPRHCAGECKFCLKYLSSLQRTHVVVVISIKQKFVSTFHINCTTQDDIAMANLYVHKAGYLHLVRGS